MDAAESPTKELKMAAHYEKWAARLAGENPPIHEIEPEAGFWRVRRSKTDRTFVGVAIWHGANGLLALRDHREVSVDRVWPWCGRYPISEQAYREWDDTGTWPDADPAVTAPPSHGMGHNNAPTDEAEIIADQIEAAKGSLKDYAKIESDEADARAQSLRSRLLELSGEADKIRKTAKQPHLDASVAVDAKWMPLVKDAKDAADIIKKAMQTWLNEKADRDRASGPSAPPPTTVVRGGYGRAASVRVVNIVTKVTDWDALWGFLRDRQEMHDLMLKLAQRSVDKNFTVPGVVIEEQRRVA
jgi:hypothetical protein